MIGLNGYLIVTVNEEGFVFFLAFFNYENEADDYILKFPEENLKKIHTMAEFEEEIFEQIEVK